MEWYIGCSGFYYKEWKELFYPKGLPAARWFEYYCNHFNTLEINNTFYRFPQLKTLQGWYEKSPAPFIFSVKVPRLITHQHQFENTEETLHEFYLLLQDGLKEKLGPVLFQLPPQMAYAPALLDTITSQLHASFANVIEFRHISWWRPEVQQELQRRGIAFCGVSFPGLPDEVMATAPLLYYRFHGVPRLYHSSYGDAYLKTRVEQAASQSEATRTFLYFNNTASAAALSNARFVQGIVY
ncbi:DUF72 domain-containing protein [Paraflavisolibacter sp. H34]|uniref:DUF72 domain-containing protein n=1 Tax=Huijunlia imazamoxiresistens TaxID=3127457 RepID=UPI00301AC8E1